MHVPTNQPNFVRIGNCGGSRVSNKRYAITSTFACLLVIALAGMLLIDGGVHHRRQKANLLADKGASIRHHGWLFKALRAPTGAWSQPIRENVGNYVALGPVRPNPTEPLSGALHTVYSGATVKTGVISEDGGLCFVGTVSGETAAVCTTGEGVSSGLGLMIQEASEYHIMGVLPENATEAKIEDPDGTLVGVPLNAEDGYAITTKVAPARLRVTVSNGSQYDVPIGTHNHSER